MLVFGKPDVLIQTKNLDSVAREYDKDAKKRDNEILLATSKEETQELDDALMRVKLDFDKT